MKFLALTALAALLPFLAACDAGKKSGSPAASGENAAPREDVPILPVKSGDAWIYQVNLEIPAGVTAPGSAEVNTKFQRTRTYLGKVAAADGLPATDCFEVVVPGSPNEREFVDITEDRIMMRGSLIMRPETTQPMWLDTPVPFVIAGMKPGTADAGIATADGSLTRKTEVIAREEITVPAGKFRCIRLLTTGSDGDVELRRTIWFAPGKGIIREEKNRYRQDKLLFREAQELAELKQAK